MPRYETFTERYLRICKHVSGRKREGSGLRRTVIPGRCVWPESVRTWLRLEQAELGWSSDAIDRALVAASINGELRAA